MNNIVSKKVEQCKIYRYISIRGQTKINEFPDAGQLSLKSFGLIY